MKKIWFLTGFLSDRKGCGYCLNDYIMLNDFGHAADDGIEVEQCHCFTLFLTFFQHNME